MPRRTTCAAVLVTAAAASVAGGAVPAGAAYGVVVGPGFPGHVVAASPDGRVLASETSGSGLVAVGLGPGGSVTARRIGETHGGALAASASDGSAAVSATAAGAGGTDLAARPPVGPFTPLAPLTTVPTENSTASLAVGGGTLLAGGERTLNGDAEGRGAASQPVVFRRAAGGAVLPTVVLPGGPNALDAGGDVQVGVDGAGRAVAAWGRGGGRSSRTVVAPIAADGGVGPVTELPGVAPSSRNDTEVDVRVAPDGSGWVSWTRSGRTLMAPVSTTGGVDLARRVVAGLRGSSALAADGSAVVAAYRAGGSAGPRLLVTSRAPGGRFTRPSAVRAIAADPASVAIAGGRWVVAQAADDDGPARATLVTGRAGRRPSAPVPLPVASVSELDVQAAVPGGRPLVVLRALRTAGSPTGPDRTRSDESVVARPVAGRRPRARATVRVPRDQRLGPRQSLRLTIRCDAACAYRVLSPRLPRDGAGDFDQADVLRRGTHRIVVPFDRGLAGDGDGSPGPRLRRPVATRLTIAVDDARGGETIARRRVLLRP